MSDLAKALAAFQAEAPTIAKGNTADAGNYKYKYADLSDVSEKVLPLLGKHGLSFSAKPTVNERGSFVLAYTLRHESGEFDSGEYPLPNGNAQQIGSAITYARRYTLCAITGVAPGGDDDDGANAVDVRVEAQPRQTWDSTEQEELREGYEAEIAAASAEELDEIAKRLQSAKKSGTLAPGIYNRLVGLGAKRRAELDLAKAKTPVQDPLPDNTDPS